MISSKKIVKINRWFYMILVVAAVLGGVWILHQSVESLSMRILIQVCAYGFITTMIAIALRNRDKKEVPIKTSIRSPGFVILSLLSICIGASFFVFCIMQLSSGGHMLDQQDVPMLVGASILFAVLTLAVIVALWMHLYY